MGKNSGSQGWVRKGGYQSGKPNNPNRVPPSGASPTKPVNSSGTNSGDGSSSSGNSSGGNR